MNEDNYVIRVYRRGEGHGEARRRHDRVRLTGIADQVETGKRTAFHDIEELWAILAHLVKPSKQKSGSPRR